jgi:hypothetical protein
VVAPTATGVNLVAGHFANITAVQEVAPGVYCLTPIPTIIPETDTAAVSPEVSYSTAGVGVIAANAKHTHCPASTFEVDTYTPGTTTLAGGYAFTIVVP